MGKFARLFRSRKFLASVVAAGVALVGNVVGVDDETQNEIITIIVGYVVAQGWADSGKASTADH